MARSLVAPTRVSACPDVTVGRLGPITRLEGGQRPDVIVADDRAARTGRSGSPMWS